MEKLLLILCVIVGIGGMLLIFPNGLTAMMLVAFLSFICIYFIRKSGSDSAEFLVQIFLIGLLARLAFGLFVQVFDLRGFFGGDSLTYDFNGQILAGMWSGTATNNDFYTQTATSTSGSGWGMNYLTGAIYFVLGTNNYAAQSFCTVIGAATAPLTYICAYSIFGNKRVGRMCAWCIALFPAFVIWSGQLLKDGLIIFLLVITMIVVVKLQEKLNYSSIFILILTMSGIITLRFYIFYMVLLAVIGAFVIGQSNSAKSIMQRLVVLIVLGLALTYLGVSRNAGEAYNKYADLTKIQNSRSYMATSAGSGFGADVDVSTTDGAISALPIGFSYLMFAPFPWNMGSFRSAITLPEMIVWWSSMPFLVAGIIYAVRNRLRKALPILIFTLMLTLAYSVFQGNVGTAYRQRTQIQVFLFMFIAVGWTLRQEKRENKKLLQRPKR